MKIAIITQYYKPEIGAPQNRLFEMAHGLVGEDNNVFVITGMPNYPTGKIFKEYKWKIFKKEFDGEIIVKRYWLYASNSKRIFPRILNMLSFSFSSLFSFFYILLNRVDYIIVESPPLTLGITGYILSRLTFSKLVLNVSDLWPLSAKELGAITDGVCYKLLEFLESFLYKRAVFCMGQSEEIVEYMSKHGAWNTYLFRNGVDPKRFTIAKEFRKKEGKKKIVYAGLLGFAQGIYMLCKNINFYKMGVEFHIYGDGGERKKIEELLSDGVERGIYYHGKVSSKEIPSILLSAYLTLVPLAKNIFGAVPSKIYESMAAGVPIIFLGAGEGAKIIKENELGWVSPVDDYASVEKNIAFALENVELVEKYRKNCSLCAEFKFNRPLQIKALNTFLTESLK